MATFTTYYETGSLRRGTMEHHKTTHKTRAGAVEAARKISRKTGHFVAVMRNGIEVASCYNGKCER